MSSKNIVHIATSFGTGGAGIAAQRLHNAMLKNGIKSHFITVSAYSGASQDANKIVFPEKNKILLKIKSAFFYVAELLGNLRNNINPKLAWSNASFGFKVEHLPEIKNADIIYIHWTNQGFLSISSIKNILRLQKPVFWVLHDMWAFTGGCHYSFECEKYKSLCCKCPLQKKRWKDVARKNFNKKLKKLSKYTNLHIITPSEWLGECAKQSVILNKKNVATIHNPISNDIFKPMDRAVARKLFNLPLDKKLVLFGADFGADNPYKGWSFLETILSDFQRDDVELVVFGSEYNKSIADKMKLRVHFMGRLSDPYSLAMLYNAVDVFAAPSLADNWPSTIMEANCCGIPVLAFKVGGIQTMIKHLHNGYSAEYKNVDDLAAGLSFILSREWDKYSISDFVHPLTDEKIIVDQHKTLWKSVL